MRSRAEADRRGEGDWIELLGQYRKDIEEKKRKIISVRSRIQNPRSTFPLCDIVHGTKTLDSTTIKACGTFIVDHSYRRDLLVHVCLSDRKLMPVPKSVRQSETQFLWPCCVSQLPSLFISASGSFIAPSAASSLIQRWCF